MAVVEPTKMQDNDLYPLSSFQVGFLGGGAMAESIFKGLLRRKVVSSVQVYDIYPPRRAALAQMGSGIHVVSSVRDLLGAADVVILATKPDAVASALDMCKDLWSQEKLLLSICAGVKVESLEKSLLDSGCEDIRIVRAMPNLPCLVGEAATAICCNEHCGPQDRSNANAIMSNVGSVEEVPERLMDAITGFSGSGPGFAFMFIEALADSAVLHGVPRRVARKFAAQVAYGSAKMVLEDPSTHPGDFRNRVESPGGTTIAGTQAMEQAGFRGAVIAGVTAATKRSGELGARK